MTISIEKLVSLVREKAELDLGPMLARCESETDSAVLERIVLHTVNCLGLHVATSGEVCDPRPAPNPFPAPRQQNVHYLGGKRGRYGR